MTNELYDILDDLIEEITKSSDFTRLKELKKIVEEKYFFEISNFTISKENYYKELELKEYSRGLEQAKNKLIAAKERLYTIPEVKEYKRLESKIEKELKAISNDISSAISNKFKLKKFLED